MPLTSNNKYSNFDAIGSFNQYYNKGTVSSLALPMDAGAAIPSNEVDNFVNDISGAPKPAVEEPKGFWHAVGKFLTDAYNFSSHTATFALLATDTNSPLMKQRSLQGLKSTWTGTRGISPGQAVTGMVAETVATPFRVANDLVKATTKSTSNKLDDFAKGHFLAASEDFNIFDKEQRYKAFGEQTFGKVGSWFGDAIARFTIDPTIIVGKAVKVYKAGAYTLKAGQDLKDILTKTAAGTATRQEKRVAGTFDNFLKVTNGMNESELFRIKAIRNSSNPAVLADLLATANRLHADDLEKLYQTKADIIHMSMGDMNAFNSLVKKSDVLAAKVGAMNMEVAGAKHLGDAVDELGNPVFEELAGGINLEKTKILIKQKESQLEELNKKIEVNGVLSPTAVPYIDTLGKLRRGTLSDAYLQGNKLLPGFVDIPLGSTGVVRFLNGFAYKRPKGWIDFADNQSVQTVDNMLNRVIGMSSKRAERYAAEMEASRAKIASKTLDKEEIKLEKNRLKELKADFDKANFTVERRNQLFATYTNAATPDARSLAYQNIEKELFETVSKQFGYDVNQVGLAYGRYASARTKAINLIKERSYSGAIDPLTGNKLGAKAALIPSTEGLSYSIPLPLNESQLIQEMATLDIDKMYQVLKRAERADSFGGNITKQNIYKAAIRGKLAVNGLADELDQLLKFEVLARLGYPVRNVTEGSMRIMSTVGPLALLHAAAVGSKNLIYKGASKITPEGWFKLAHHHRLETDLITLQSKYVWADAAEKKAIGKEIDDIQAVLAGKMKDHPKYGIGTIEILGHKIQDAKGVTAEQAAFINEKFINNQSKIYEDMLVDSKNRMTNMLQNTGDFVDIVGTDPLWAENYLRVVNRIIRNSELTRRILNGETPEQVTAWLRTTKEGRSIAKAIGAARGGEDAAEIARLNFVNVEHLFQGSGGQRLMEIAKDRALKADDLKWLGTDARLYPTVNGSQVSVVNGTHSAVTMYNNVLKRFYETFGQIPENNMTKSPLFVDLYRRRMAASVEKAMTEVKGDTIPDAYMRNMERKAREWARAEMRRNLYDLTEKTDAAHSLKYIFPFFGAFSDVIEKWGKIIIDDPSVLAKLNTIYQSPDRVGLTEERNGITYINLPSSWAKAMSLFYTDRVSIPKASLNLLFQGGAWWNPGAGWFVQAAASKIVMHYPSLETTKLVQEILPYGAQDKSVKDLLIQSSAGRKLAAVFDASDPQRASLTARIMAEEMTKFENGLRDTEPTKAEINDRTIKTLALSVATRLTLPFATNVQSPYQFYIDEFHRLQAEDPMTANEKFYDAYGEAYFNMTVSLSKNNTGINATLSADKASKQLGDLIAQNPQYGWFVVGPNNTGEFSPTVFAGQKIRSTAPGSTDKFRGQRDPFDAFNQTMINKGWIQYRKGSALIDAMRISSGLTSLNSPGAEYLQQQKQALVDALKVDNPEWFKSKSTITTAKVNRFLNYASSVVEDPRIANRPDVQSLKRYMQGRAMIQGMLDTRASQSLDNASNFDLKQQWYNFVGLLIANDVTFGDIHSRILENDDLSRGA